METESKINVVGSDLILTGVRILSGIKIKAGPGDERTGLELHLDYDGVSLEDVTDAFTDKKATICWQDKTKRDGSPFPESNTTVNVRVADLLVKKTRVVGKKLSEMTVEELLAEAAKRPMTDEQRKIAERLSRPVNKDRIDGEPVKLSPEAYAEKVAQEDLAKANRGKGK